MLSVICPSAFPLSGNGVCKVWFTCLSAYAAIRMEEEEKMGVCGVSGDGRRKDVSVVSHRRCRHVSHLELT